MQDCLALLTELRQLRDRGVYNAVEVVLSGERWSPVAAVLLSGCRLPEVIQPEQSDLRIPIPDLYGFATSASVVLFPSTLFEADEQGEVRPVPFCEDLGPENLPPNCPYFSDLRAHGEQLEGMAYLCLNPIWSPQDGFYHTPLPAFVQYVLDFLEGPHALVENDLDYCQEQWAISRDPWWLIRIGYIHEGLGDLDQARQMYLQGEEAFPGRKEFAALAHRVGRRMMSLATKQPHVDEKPDLHL